MLLRERSDPTIDSLLAKTKGPFLVILALMVSLALLAGGCSDRECPEVACNLPPTTSVSSDPPEEACSSFTVRVFWAGEDPDGEVVAFEVATLRGIPERIVEHLEPDMLPWGTTTSMESTFVVDTDSCCVSEEDPPDSLVHWLVLVRSVDDLGARDPAPASRLFRMCNVLPRVAITCPRLPHTPDRCLPRTFRVEWEGEDPDGDDSALEYKYIVIDADRIGPGWRGLPALSSGCSGWGHEAPPVNEWSEWVGADCTYVCDLEVDYRQDPVHYYKYIAVTARDEDGGVLTPGLWSIYNQDDNWFHFAACDPVGHGVTLIIDGGDLGRRSSLEPHRYETEVSTAFHPAGVRFTVFPHEDRCEGATAYKYYYDSPGDPGSSWDVWTPFDPLQRFVWFPEDGGTFTPSLGRHVFVAEVKDLCGVISHCELHFEVVPGGNRVPERKVFLVDDDRACWLEPRWPGYEEEQDAFWIDVLTGYEWDRFDTGQEYDNRLSPRFISDATTVIWVVDMDVDYPPTQLLEVCTRYGNYLWSYVKAGGNLILMGRDPVYACGYWPDGTPNPRMRSTYERWDFRPEWRWARRETVYHWMWDIFGIERMGLASPPKSFTALWPCDGCHEAFPDTIELGPQASRVGGEFPNAQYITRIRDDSNVVPLFSTARRVDDDWIDSGSDHLIGVYVPADGVRGHAAYVGVAEYWFDHAEMKAMIRQLLELFGEEPL